MATLDPDQSAAAGYTALAHVADTSPAPLHSAVWAEWREMLLEHPPGRLDPHADSFAGFGGERIPLRISMPEAVPQAIVVVAPDADNSWSDHAPLTSQGLIVVQLGLRGCEIGSPATKAWASAGLGEGLNRAEDALKWHPIQAAGDIACAMIASVQTFDLPLFARGRSLGAGLALLAIAGLGQQLRPQRLVLELPGLGDWKWRWAQASLGSSKPRGISGGLLEYASRFPARRAELFNSLRLIDSVVSASRVNCPTLCKLAMHDQVVPAPTAAAVFNALGCNTGEKWRFVVPVGHADAGVSNARRHVLFERCAADFLDPSTMPTQAMSAWSNVLSGGGDDQIQEHQEGLFSDSLTPNATDAALVNAYEQAARTLDDLPYTPEFDRFYNTIREPTGLSPRDAFHRLHNLRKAGRLPRMGRAPGTPPRIDPEQEQRLAELVIEKIGKLSLRDRLPYSPEFDDLVVAFNAQAGLSLDPHEVWRLIAKLAK